jgi:predicted RNA-binding Zn ribbon-like protein
MVESSPEVELVKAFANTVDLEDGTDELATAASAADWLLAHRLVDLPVWVSEADLGTLLDLRTGVREALGADGTPSARRLGVGELVLRTVPVLVSLDPSTPLTPSPGLAPVPHAIAALGISWAHLAVTGQRSRLKRCPDDTCGWVFWDVSRNNSRRWCTMRVCGNRAKARTFSARQRATRV